MADIIPFRPYRYTAKAGAPEQVLTQPYDKISPEMQKKYLAKSPYNLVRVILGERKQSDTETENVYTRSAAWFRQWTADGVLAQDAEPAFYPYFQEFTVPDTGERLLRKGFIGLGKVEDYEANVVYRHERTLAGPKKDRFEVLTHTSAHFGQIFMLYPDQEEAIDRILDQAATGAPLVRATDDYGAVHSLWRMTDPALIAEVKRLMSDKKLLIADGHHRYETSLNYRNAHPELEDAKYTMMTFVNMYSPGLKILATHRVVKNLEGFTREDLLKKAAGPFQTRHFDTLVEMNAYLREHNDGSVRIGVAAQGSTGVDLLERPRHSGELDVPILHQEILGGLLGISEEAVRDEKYLKYVRGAETAVDLVKRGEGQVAFLLEPTPIDDMAQIAFDGGVMPQKSTDFYPKLLTGMCIYRLER
jgi:uncharacterized protein (DUF1015 family)